MSVPLPPGWAGSVSVPGVVGGGYLFNGQGDFIQVPPSASTNFGCKPFSVDLWVKRSPPVAGPGFVNLFLKYEDDIIAYSIFFRVRHPRCGDSIGYSAQQLRPLNPHVHFPETKREI
mgnify:CR=1 FL=1